MPMRKYLFHLRAWHQPLALLRTLAVSLDARLTQVILVDVRRGIDPLSGTPMERRRTTTLPETIDKQNLPNLPQYQLTGCEGRPRHLHGFFDSSKISRSVHSTLIKSSTFVRDSEIKFWHNLKATVVRNIITAFR
jgi:hypothetical protein